MAPPLFSFGCVLINRNKQTSFVLKSLLLFKQQSKKTKVEKRIRIICLVLYNGYLNMGPLVPRNIKLLDFYLANIQLTVSILVDPA